MIALPRPARLAALLLGLVGLLVLGACTTPPPEAAFPQITFAHKAPIKLAVGEVVVERAYSSPGAPPNVEHLFQVPPGAAAERWARDRLVAAGTGGRARYVVKEASVVEVPLETSGGIKGLVTTEQSERYDARLAVEIELVAEGGRTEGTATARAERSISVPEDATLTEREQAWFRMVETMMTELDAQLEQTIRKVFFAQVVE